MIKIVKFSKKFLQMLEIDKKCTDQKDLTMTSLNFLLMKVADLLTFVKGSNGCFPWQINALNLMMDSVRMSRKAIRIMKSAPLSSTTSLLLISRKKVAKISTRWSLEKFRNSSNRRNWGLLPFNRKIRAPVCGFCFWNRRTDAFLKADNVVM